MKKPASRSFRIALLGLLSVVAATATILLFRDDKPTRRITVAQVEAMQLYLALWSFAEEHAGALPRNLDELHPKYLEGEAGKRCLKGAWLTTPGATLKTLSKGTTIVVKLVPLFPDLLITVQADGAYPVHHL